MAISLLLIWTTVNGMRRLVDVESIECLALNIYHESRSESRLSQFAVTQVVFNRTDSPRFPDSVCGVVKEGLYQGGHPIRNRCQFSWYCDGHNDDPVDRVAWGDAVELATWMLTARDYLPQLVGNALWYHADYVNPRWSRVRERVLKVDSHIFYR